MLLDIIKRRNIHRPNIILAYDLCRVSGMVVMPVRDQRVELFLFVSVAVEPREYGPVMVIAAVNKKRLPVLVSDHCRVAGILCSKVDRCNDHLAASGICGQFQTARHYRYDYSKCQKMQECASTFVGPFFSCFHCDQFPHMSK